MRVLGVAPPYGAWLTAMTSAQLAFLNGKLANVNGAPCHVRWIGTTTRLWSDGFYRSVDVWQPTGYRVHTYQRAYLRFERVDGIGRARMYYDPSGATRDAVIRDNSV